MEQQLEELLKQKTYDYRMYPSNKVWTGVNNHLHGKQRLTLVTLLVLFIITALLFNSDPQGINANKQDQNTLTYAYNPISVSKKNTPFSQTYKNNIAYTETISTVAIAQENSNDAVSKKIKTFTNTLTSTPATNNIKNTAVVASTNITKTNFFKQNEIIEVDDIDLSSSSNIAITANEPQEMLSTITAPTIKQFNKNNNQQNISANIAPIKIATKKATVRAQYYITPSLSYRTLIDERKLNANSLLANQSLDKSVTHKPSFGVETGLSWLIQMDKKLRLRTGAQINYNRYSIKASSGVPELTTIALNGTSNITNISTLRNASNNKLGNWLDNSSLQFAIPIGVELDVLGNDNIQFSVGTSIQPSFVLRNKMYLLSTDFKSYVEESSLARRINLSGAFETFVTFNTKKTRWQIGPQLRYQFLSTYDKSYPIKENLFDYGFKIGVSKPF
jgi:hypothetical protein